LGDQRGVLAKSQSNGAGTALMVDELRRGWERERVLLEGVIDDLRNRLNAAEEERRTTLRQLTALTPASDT
jgi:hypothetical protein